MKKNFKTGISAYLCVVGETMNWKLLLNNSPRVEARHSEIINTWRIERTCGFRLGSSKWCLIGVLEEHWTQCKSSSICQYQNCIIDERDKRPEFWEGQKVSHHLTHWATSVNSSPVYLTSNWACGFSGTTVSHCSSPQVSTSTTPFFICNE